jgi:hypothetical protein
MCPNGTCQPELVYTATGTIAGLWIDGGFVYTLESAAGTGNTTTYTFNRGPVAGGTAQLVATVPAGMSPSDKQVAGGQIVFSTTGTDSLSGVPEDYYYTVPGAGGTPVKFASIAEPLGSPLIATNGTNAYFWDYDMYNMSMARLLKATLPAGGYTNVATYPNNYFDFILILGSTVYFPGNGTSGSNKYYIVEAFTGSTTLTSVFENDTASLATIMVDSTGFYSSDLANASNTESLVHTPLSGKNPVSLAPEGGRSLSADDTNLYYLSAADAKTIRRVSKAGGTAAQTFYSDPATLKYVLVNTGYVYFANAGTVRRLVTTFTP